MPLTRGRTHCKIPLITTYGGIVMPNYVGYLRVSTKRQGESGLGLEARMTSCFAGVRQNPWRQADCRV